MSKGTRGRGTLRCPSCQETLAYTLRLGVAVFPKLGGSSFCEMAQVTKHFMTSEFCCPTCQNVLRFDCEVSILGVQVKGGPIERAKLPMSLVSTEKHREPLSDEELQVAKECRDSGMLDAFVQVVNGQMRGPNVPRDMERFFITFLQTAVKGRLPSQMLLEFAREFQGHIEFWKAQGIGMVLSDGKVCCFIPVVRGMPQRVSKYFVAEGTPGKSGRVQRTTAGYVPAGSRVFMEALLHSWGDKGRDMQAVPIRP